MSISADGWSTLMGERSGSGLDAGTAIPEITRTSKSRTHLTQTFLCEICDSYRNDLKVYNHVHTPNVFTHSLYEMYK
jgi:hypothetical protein